MSDPYKRIDRGSVLADLLTELILDSARAIAKHGTQAFRITHPAARQGATLRPGRQTPLWNELRQQIRPYATRYGDQANLARLLGLPRQHVNAFLTRGKQMPDAERTLQLLAWLVAVRAGHRPS